ncbi:transposase [Paracoccus sp. (in: a-proteobacteria)]|uniref:transposase n=1 Tax=Paracoccus sp. TaxID=267 RepID=UPI003A4C83A5
MCDAGRNSWAERRRFWHDDDKLEIVMSVGVGGASVTQVAQRHEIRRQQIYAWRHDLKKKGFGRLTVAPFSIRWILLSRPRSRWRNCLSPNCHHRPPLNCVCGVVAVCILTARWIRPRLRL